MRNALGGPVAGRERVAYLVLALLFLLGSTRTDTFADYMGSWSDRAHGTLKSEPNWRPPIYTITPRLTQVARETATLKILNW